MTLCGRYAGPFQFGHGFEHARGHRQTNDRTKHDVRLLTGRCLETIGRQVRIERGEHFAGQLSQRRITEARHQKIIQPVLVREPRGRLQRAEPRRAEVTSRVVEREHVDWLFRNDRRADVQQGAGTRQLDNEPSMLRFSTALGLDLSVATIALVAPIYCPVSNFNEQTRRAVSKFAFANGHGVALPRPKTPQLRPREGITPVAFRRIASYSVQGFPKETRQRFANLRARTPSRRASMPPSLAR